MFGSDATQPFVGRALSRPLDYSQQTAGDIDDEGVLRFRPSGPRQLEAAEAI